MNRKEYQKYKEDKKNKKLLKRIQRNPYIHLELVHLEYKNIYRFAIQDRWKMELIYKKFGIFDWFYCKDLNRIKSKGAKLGLIFVVE